MSTELSNGVIIPEEYSDDWYDEMSINLRKLNDVITAASDNATDIQRLDTDKANQSDLTALTSRVSQNETDITALQTAVSGALKREIVQTLPTEDISTTTIYMIRNSQSSGTNIYDEYMYINSQWELIGTSATDFSNYYTKNETDNLLSGKVDNSTLGSYYTKTESDNLLSAKANQTDLTSLSGRVTQNETDITALQTAVSGALKREIVQSLPTQDISTTTIYMIRNATTSGDNIYDEYMYINNLWELIGTSATDFSNYYTKTEIDTLLSGKQASLSQTQLDAVNSGIDSSKVQQIATNTSDIRSLQSGKANDNSVVHLTGDESVSGVKSFIGTRTEFKRSNNDGVVLFNNDSFVKGDTPSDTTYLCRKYYGGATSIQTAIGYTSVTVSSQGNRSMIQFYCLANISGATSRTELQLNYDKSLSGNDAQYINVKGNIYPNADNSYNLGSLSNRWKKFNGLNPSSLGMPDLSNGIDISSYLDTSQSSRNYYTPSVNGWISIKGRSSSGTNGVVIMQGDFCQVGQSVIDLDTSNRISFCMLPVMKNVQVEIWLKSVTSLDSAKFFPCQGNV